MIMAGATRKKKKINYVSLEAGAFLSDLVFQVMNAEERGVYCSLIFYLYENNGKLPLDFKYLQALTGCKDFEKVWEFIKQKFIVKDGLISHKRVFYELHRAKQALKKQSDKGLRGAWSRWNKNGTGNGTAITSEAKEANRSEENEEKEITNSTTNASKDKSPWTPAPAKNLSGRFGAVSINSPINSFVSSLRHATVTAGDLEVLCMRIYDILAGIFKGRTVSDSTSIRNLLRWIKEQIKAGKFEPDIFKVIVNMATESNNGKSRKPIAVFFAQVKKELGYKNSD